MPAIISIGELIVEIMRPEAGIPLDETGPFTGPFASGAPAIFISQAARLGHTTGFIGACGTDDFGECLVNRLTGDGVDCSTVARITGVATGCAFVTYFTDGSRKFIFHIANSAAGFLPEPTADMFVGTKWLHICGSTLSAGETMRKRCVLACELAKQAGAKISFDPNLRPELLGGEEAVRKICAPVLEVASLILPSASEAEVLTQKDNSQAACEALLEQGADVVALKQGAQGCSVFTPQEQVFVPAYRVNSVDPTGAGDCFDAGFVTGLLENLTPLEAGRRANACGALGATRLGPMEGAMMREQIEEFITRQ